MSYFRKIEFNRQGLSGAVFITDEPAEAERLQKCGEAVVVYLHEGNRDRCFSGFLYAVEAPEELDEEYAEKVYRRQKGLPWNVLETERCLIRETVPEDVEDFFLIYSEPSITRFMEDLYPDKEQEKAYIREYIEKIYGFYGFGVWTVVEKASGDIIGRAGFSYREGSVTPELGFIIGVPWQRKGYAGEVCSAILQYGWEELGFREVQALVEPGNEASLRLCDRLGFCREKEVTVENKVHFLLKCYK
ncbi:MAG: GNAT family N-acetyltransferase [Acetatifactor sp.]